MLARKSLEGTVVQNVLEHGTGALNIDACRVEAGGRPLRVGDYKSTDNNSYQGRMDGSLMGGSKAVGTTDVGRWPANVLHDGSDEVVGAFPDSKGQLADVSHTAPSSKTSNVYGKMNREGEASANRRYDDRGGTNFAPLPGQRRHDEGSAARFFYCAKASKSERNQGLDGLPVVTADPYGQHRGRRMDDNDVRFDGKPPSQGRNTHPTVKPVELMRYLCQLVTPPGGVVLDPFMGSGSTGVACAKLGLKFIGIEDDPNYFAVACKRIEDAYRQGDMFVEAPKTQPTQMDLPASARGSRT